jgi:hypothetical protein
MTTEGTPHVTFTHRLLFADAPGPEPGHTVKYGRTNTERERYELLHADVYALRTVGCYGVIDVTEKWSDGDPVTATIELPDAVLRALACAVLANDRRFSSSVREILNTHIAGGIYDALDALGRGQVLGDA